MLERTVALESYSVEPPDLSAPVRSEADVETRILLPILRQLGWSDGEVHPKVPVTFQSGRKKGRPFEADFVLAPVEPRPPPFGFVVVEAKPPDEKLDDAADQAVSYAVALKAALYCTCNGLSIEVWRLTFAAEDNCAFKCAIADLSAHWGELELNLSRASVLSFYSRVAPQRAEVADVDVGSYVMALRHDAEARRLLDRVAVTPDGEAVTISGAANKNAAIVDSGCTVISGPGGRGKSSALALLAHSQAESFLSGGSRRVPISLRASAVTEQGVSQAIADELATLMPSLASPVAVQAWMRKVETLVLFDDWERASDDARALINRFVRDSAGARCAVVVAARDCVEVHGRNRELKLGVLTENEQRDIILALRPEIPWDEHRLKALINNPPYSLRSLLQEPVILTAFLRLMSLERMGVRYPQDLPALLDEVLEESIGRNHVDRRAKTEELVAVCSELSRRAGPYSLRMLQEIVTSLALSWSPKELIGELIDLCVLTAERHSAFDFSHDLWRLHFQTKDRAPAVKLPDNVTAWIEDLGDDLELAVPFLAALLTDTALQEQLLQQLLARSFSFYCKALRARVSTRQADSQGKEARLLASVRDTYRSLVDSLCPNLKSYLEPWKSLRGPTKSLESLLIAGVLDDGSLSYCFSALPAQDDRKEIVLATSHESFMDTVERNAGGGHWQTRSAALRHYGIRIDSGHAIAVHRLVEEVADALLREPFVGAEWLLREECWRRVAHLVGDREQTSGLTLTAFGDWLRANTRDADAAVAMVDELKGYGLSATLISELALPQPDLRQTSDARSAYTLERRHHRVKMLFDSATRTYRELCERYLPGFAMDLAYSSFPMRPRVSIMRVITEDEWDAWYWWEPVRTWAEAGAIVEVVNDRTDVKSRDEVRALLAQENAALDRRTARLGLAWGEIGDWGRTDKDVTGMVHRLLRDDLSTLKSLCSGIR